MSGRAHQLLPHFFVSPKNLKKKDQYFGDIVEKNRRTVNFTNKKVRRPSLPISPVYLRFREDGGRNRILLFFSRLPKPVDNRRPRHSSIYSIRCSLAFSSRSVIKMIIISSAYSAVCRRTSPKHTTTTLNPHRPPLHMFSRESRDDIVNYFGDIDGRKLKNIGKTLHDGSHSPPPAVFLHFQEDQRRNCE